MEHGGLGAGAVTNGWVFLGIVTLICTGGFVNGIRFSRVTRNPWAGRKLGPFAVKGSELSADKVRLMGRVQMIAAPIFWLLFVAIIFGLFGPINGIKIIQF